MFIYLPRERNVCRIPTGLNRVPFPMGKLFVLDNSVPWNVTLDIGPGFENSTEVYGQRLASSLESYKNGEQFEKK